MINKLILIVEDEFKIAEAIEAYLKNSGYSTIVASDGKDALQIFEENNPDLVVLDLMLPTVSGEEICQSIRKKSRIPIIMLTAKSREDDKVEGLNMGADDYITKPFSPRELVARVNSLFRRCTDGISLMFSKSSWNNDDLTADFNLQLIKKQNRIVSLTQSEYKIFSALAKRPNKIFTRDEIIEIALGSEFEGYDRTIDSHIKNLRSKIEDDSSNPIYILTIRGVGYKFGSDSI